MSGKWESYGATEHTKECHGQFDWLHPETVRISPYMYERKIREVLEINKLKTINEKDKTFTVLNRDNGDYVTTNSWKPLFMKLGNSFHGTSYHFIFRLQNKFRKIILLLICYLTKFVDVT